MLSQIAVPNFEKQLYFWLQSISAHTAAAAGGFFPVLVLLSLPARLRLKMPLSIQYKRTGGSEAKLHRGGLWAEHPCYDGVGLEVDRCIRGRVAGWVELRRVG